MEDSYKIFLAVKKVTEQFLDYPERWLTYGENNQYTLTLRRDYDEPYEWLVITTWGYDMERVHIPQSRAQVINMKCRAQLGMYGELSPIWLRYTLEK